MSRITTLAVFALLILVGTSARMYSGSVDTELTRISVPTQGEAGEPFLTRLPDGGVAASWIERSDDVARLVFSRLQIDGAWSSPSEIASGSTWFVNWADVPSIAVHPDGSLIAHWLDRLGDERYAYGVRFSLSDDGGDTWSDPDWLHEDRSPTEHGFASIVPHDAGFMAVWLDGNGYATERREMAVHARTIGTDGALGIETAVDSRTCDCCPTSLVDAGGGRLLSLYRDRSADETRDIYVVAYENGSWSTPEPVASDGWSINACPVHGPSADVHDDNVVVGWFTMAGGAPEVRIAFSADAGRTFSDPIRTDLGRPAGRVAVRMLSPNEAVILWLEGADPENDQAQAGLLLRTVSRDGSLGETIELANASASRSTGYPRLERSDDGWVALWTVPGEPSTLASARITWE